MTLGEIILKWRTDPEHKMSQQAFAEKINTSRMYISMLERNFNPSTGKPITPGLAIIKACATAMNIDIEELLKMLDNDQLIFLNEDKYQEQFNHFDKNISTIDLDHDIAKVFVYGSIPAGIPMECIEDILEVIDIPAKWLKGGQKFFGLKIKGNSMSPEYLDGDIVIFEQRSSCESGDDCVVMVNGSDGTFKRVYKNENGIILQPINNTDFQPISYSNEQIESLPVKILGIAKELRRSK